MEITPRNFVKTLSLIHIVLAAGPLSVAIFMYFTNTSEVNNTTESDMFIYVFPAIGLLGIFGSMYMFNLLLKNLKKLKTLKPMLMGYQKAAIVKYALIEGPAFLNIIWFSITGNFLYLTVGGTLILYLFIQRLKAEKIEKDLELNRELKTQFYKLDTSL